MSFDISMQYDRLYRYCYYHTHNRILAQDIVQEAFTRYMERYGSLDEKNAVPYLYVIARNLCIDRYRRQGTQAEKYLQEQTYEQEQTICLTESEDNTLITKLSVQRALSRLSEEERELLLLISVNEVSAREAGMILGISRFAVYRRLRLAQKHFRTELGKEGIDGDY
ncbi:MAG: RNA polymerase sigma factor [Lachnospiraceae bacterium]|nr:RNA polymerase sigma factor [Lachnospiraceae bacterium]